MAVQWYFTRHNTRCWSAVVRKERSASLTCVSDNCGRHSRHTRRMSPSGAWLWTAAPVPRSASLPAAQMVTSRSVNSYLNDKERLCFVSVCWYVCPSVCEQGFAEGCEWVIANILETVLADDKKRSCFVFGVIRNYFLMDDACRLAYVMVWLTGIGIEYTCEITLRPAC